MQNSVDLISASSFSSSSHSFREDPEIHLPNDSTPIKTHGGWKSVKYILGNESFEKLASIGLIANLSVYLHANYNMDGISIVNVFNVWSGSTNLTPLLGAFLSDAYLGRYRTLLFGSIASFLGMAMMTLTASVDKFRPATCNFNASDACQSANGWQLALLYIGLGLLAIGAGGIRPCNIAFGADQFDSKTEKGRAQLESFFNWWYFSFTVALVIALTVVVYIQSNVSWIIGYGLPTACLLISIVIFVWGKHTYVMAMPQGSVFIDIAKVLTAAWRKRNLEVTSSISLYESPNDGEEERLTRTDMFSFLDKAAVIEDPSQINDSQNPKDPWSLCSITQVEETKSLLGIIPVWITGIGCFITMDQMNTLGLTQAIQSNNKIGSFKMPPGWMGLISMICLSIWILIYEQVCVPQDKKNLKKNKRLTMRQRINIGIVMAILCMLVAGLVEKKRRESALKNGSFISPMSILALIPQFAFSGLNEAFAAVAIMEFFTTRLPNSMRTIAGAIFFLSFSVSSYLNAALVNIIHHLTSTSGKSPWLGGRDLNKATIDKYFYFIAMIAVLNLIYFNVFSHHYLKSPKATQDSRQLEEMINDST